MSEAIFRTSGFMARESTSILKRVRYFRFNAASSAAPTVPNANLPFCAWAVGSWSLLKPKGGRECRTNHAVLNEIEAAY